MRIISGSPQVLDHVYADFYHYLAKRLVAAIKAASIPESEVE